MNYCRFNNVVVFDNTYKTNWFNMPFGIFTGVNNYSQSICFAGTLMNNESANSFIWTFNTFLEIVNNNAPKIFLTNEDQAIIKAINQVFQLFGTKHALYLWHLFKNIIKNLQGILKSKWAIFIRQFYKCLDKYDENNFKIQWEKLKNDFPESINYLNKMNQKFTAMGT
ncbi:36715_t:CDS:1, partial [Gigaspora margarita]